MARQPSPWRRKGKKGPWYAQVYGVQIRLAPAGSTKTEAIKALRLVLAATPRPEGARPVVPSFREIADLFLSHVRGSVERGEMKALTLDGYGRFVGPAADAFGELPVPALNPSHVSLWLDGTRWGPTTRNNAITAVKACLNWARRAGHVAENPVRDMAKPRANAGCADLTAEGAARIFAAIPDKPFRDFVTVAWLTGARPSEVMAVEAKDLDLGRGLIVMDGKTTGRTGRMRVIYLTDAAKSVLSRLAASRPEGPLLRNRKGTPWTRHTTAERFRRLRLRIGLGPEAKTKAFRAAFVTDGLEKGVPIATMAELAGHNSTHMISRHYSRLRERKGHLRDAAKKVRPQQGDS